VRISKLEVHGFKSFPDRTALHFGPGISGIVGSNGCGKSNVVDAVKWCLGEQSAKSLRGKSMGDVIFAGAQDRTPSASAEVSISFVADDEPFPGEFARYDEVMITRRMFRDGGSEYRINQERARLLDIQDLFLDTGVTNRMYSFIEQGRIGQIVNARPEERRALFEEAAGISRYKSRKEDTELRLAETAANLERATDIVDGLQKRLRSLGRQVERASRYRRLRSRERQAELFLGLARYNALIGDRRALGESLRAAQTDEEQLQRALSRREAELKERRDGVSVLEAGVGRLRDELAELEATRREKESARQYQAREQESIRRRLETLAGQLAGAREALEDATSELETTCSDRERVESRLTTIESTLGRARDELSVLEQDIRRRQTLIERGKAQQLKLVSQIATHRAALESSGVRRRDLESQRSRLVTRRDELLADHETLAEQLEEAKLAVAEAREGHEAFVDAIERAREVLSERQADLTARQSALSQAVKAHRITEGALSAVERDEAKLRARVESMEALQSSHEGVEDDIRAALALPDVLGTLAEHLDVPEELQAALTAALGSSLDAILTRTDAAALEAARKVKGRAIVVSLEHAGAPVTGFAARLSGTPTGMTALSVLLSGCLEASDVAEALRLHRKTGAPVVVAGGGYAFVDRAGRLIVGEPRTAGVAILARRRKLAALRTEVAGIQAKVEAARSVVAEALGRVESARESVEDTQRLVESAREAVERAREDAADGELKLRSAVQQQRNAEQEIQRQSASTRRVSTDLAEIEQSISTHDEQVLRRREAIAEDLEEQAGVEEDLTSNQAALVAETANASAARERSNQLTSETAGLREKLSGLRRAENASRAAAETAARQIEQGEGEQTEGTARIEELLEDNERLAEALDEIGTKQGDLRQRLEEARERVRQEREHLTTLEEYIKGSRTRLDTARELRVDIEQRLQLTRGEITRIRESLQERHEISVSAMLDRVERDGHVTVPVDPAALVTAPGETERDEDTPQDLRITDDMLEDEATISQWVAQLEADREALSRLGEVNLLAIQEHREVSERHDELRAQREDLENSMRSIQQTIARLNKLCRERFWETFEQVNEHFQEIYPRLVGGGRARLELTDPNDLLETGVEIFAQPPGKRLQSLSLLSGGETAMVAIALIFSLFRVKPSPFCLLDEVDAPLDEGNGARFNRMLREMAERSQFIVITHNKKTMECADTLYGVTMVNPGVSTVVSVQMD
jgi:chromosome segregation protein